MPILRHLVTEDPPGLAVAPAEHESDSAELVRAQLVGVARRSRATALASTLLAVSVGSQDQADWIPSFDPGVYVKVEGVWTKTAGLP